MATVNPNFVHLHVHSEYSLLDGLGHLPELIAKAKALGQPALALTDHGAMYGSLHFFNTAKKAGIKPIIGLEAYVAQNSRTDKQVKMGSDQFHLTILAQNLKGYRNLMQLVSRANSEGFSYKPRIDDELLFELNEGLIVLSGCLSSRFNRFLQNGQDDQALELFKKYSHVFGNRFYIELQNHPTIKEYQTINPKLVKIARQLGIKIVATNDVHYLEAEDAEAQDALICVQTRKLMSDKDRMSLMDSPDLYLRSTGEMMELFKDYPEAISNTLEVADRCNVEIPTGKLIFPNFPIPEGQTEAEYFRQLTFSLAKKKLGKLTKEYTDRIEYEMKVIVDKGYTPYFLITQDFVNWAKLQGIGVGPGRGSAAGSLISYVLGITDIHPIEHGLAFERFLNPQRPTPPDIDIDFADDRRDEVIAYVSDKYGADHVGHVITFGKMEARVAIRDIGRILGLPYEDPDRIAKLIPNEPGKRVSLDQAVKTIPELIQIYQQPKFRRLIDLAKKVEGVVRHSSVHAAAIIITDKPLPNYTPTQVDTKSGKTITQYDMYALDCNISDDAIGLLKFDFLGLRNLSIIQNALSLIKVHKKIDLNIREIPLDDKKTYRIMAEGHTMGVFQLESAGMRRVARSLKPNQFSDITAMVALFRPGPMDLIPQFIEGKHNPSSIHYPHDTLIDILKETYGVMVYQEQILEIAHTMAGYTLGEADILRRAIGKKKKKLLDQNRLRFIKDSVKNGYQQTVAEKVWGFIEAFANYGFNKAHATSYAMIAYQTAYLKANYPVEYMTALMSVESASSSQNRDVKVSVAIEECRRMGIQVLPPNINHSDDDFTIEKVKGSLTGLGIRFGLNAIKHIGSAAIDNILQTRQKMKGGFKSFTQFVYETDGRKVNKTSLECLIKVGAMDEYGTRASMLENLEAIRKQATSLQSQVDGQETLFTGVDTGATNIQDTFPKLEEYPQPELLSFEKELLGMFLTQHPMAQALKAVSQRATKQIGDIDRELHLNHTFLFGGVVTRWKQVQTKKTNQLMAFGELEDSTGKIQFVVFPTIYNQSGSDIKEDSVVLLKAKVDYRDEELQLVVEKISLPDNIESSVAIGEDQHEIFIPRKTKREILEKLGQLLKSHPGDEHVSVLIPNGGQPERMALPYGVKWSSQLEKDIETLLT
ncbi:MAG: DNA polymerase III subunit alpha [Patescibacteria group bacterium]